LNNQTKHCICPITMPITSPRVPKECVGSLLLPTSDLQELSEVKFQRRVTVGTLLTLPVQNMQRRVTRKLQGPPPPDSEAESWAD
jgi:hypothetical protein